MRNTRPQRTVWQLQQELETSLLPLHYDPAHCLVVFDGPSLLPRCGSGLVAAVSSLKESLVGMEWPWPRGAVNGFSRMGGDQAFRGSSRRSSACSKSSACRSDSLSATTAHLKRAARYVLPTCPILLPPCLLWLVVDCGLVRMHDTIPIQAWVPTVSHEIISPSSLCGGKDR